MPPYADDSMYTNNVNNTINQSLLVGNDESMIMKASPRFRSITTATTTPSSESFPSKKKKSVSFSKKVRAKRVPHINDMKKAMDINKIWYNTDEFSKFRLECKTIVAHMNKINIDNNKQQEEEPHQSTKMITTICTRGLEKYTTFERESYNRRKSNVIQAVLEEQAFQRSLGIDEPEILASASTLNSYQSHTLALSLAIQDYDALVYNDDTDLQQQ